MAQRTVVELTDDLSGGPATRTIEFGLDGESYVIDLNDANAERFLSTVAPYLARTEATVARKLLVSALRRPSAMSLPTRLQLVVEGSADRRAPLRAA
jgi:hypothetical protein